VLIVLPHAGSRNCTLASIAYWLYAMDGTLSHVEMAFMICTFELQGLALGTPSVRLAQDNSHQQTSAPLPLPPSCMYCLSWPKAWAPRLGPAGEIQ